MPSSVAAFDGAGAASDMLLAAAETLVARGAVSILWLTADLRVAEVAGTAVGQPAPGTPAMDVLLAFVGLEEDLEGLKRGAGGGVLRIPNTAVMSGDDETTQRLDVTVFWVGDRNRYLVLLATVLGAGSPTVELDQEIRRRRLLEQDLAAKSQEYARINEQLEEFAYVISHDLNAPMRALRYLSADIQQAIDVETGGGDVLDHAAVRKAAAAITTQTRRMSQMMVDLLEYARIGRVEELIQKVDTRALIEAIFGTLEPSTTLRLELAGTWPVLETAAAPLDLVLRNLVENAVKHHDRPQQGSVVVTAGTTGRFAVFQIADDGRGIPAEWQQAIFEPFRKVDDAHHPESSGIGLALVKKTVTTMGGSIDVLSDAPEKRGTTFVVRWPLRFAIAEETASEFH